MWQHQRQTIACWYSMLDHRQGEDCVGNLKCLGLNQCGLRMNNVRKWCPKPKREVKAWVLNTYLRNVWKNVEGLYPLGIKIHLDM